MGSDIFRFKQFIIEQRQSAMRVGTDGIILGSWADVTGGERRILDIGCGTGLLALMMAQRNLTAHIDAVEIEPLAAAEAELNCRNSPWTERLVVHEISVQAYAAQCTEKYDSIVSNPPYFINSPHNEQLARAAARHASLLPYADLVDAVVSLLTENGRFAAIFPYSEAGIFIAKAATAGLYCNSKLNIIPISSRPVKRIAAEFSFTKGIVTEENLTIETDIKGEYTEKFRELTSPFYLRF